MNDDNKDVAILIVQFRLGHFLTYREIQTLSMVACDEHKGYHTILSNDRILKSAYIYGANSAGKSNFIKGIEYSRRKIIADNNNVYQDLDDYTHLIGDMRDTSPSYFEYLLADDMETYSYGLEVETQSGTIISEWLMEIKDDDSYIPIYVIGSEEDGGIVLEHCQINDINPKYRHMYDDYSKTNRLTTFLEYINEMDKTCGLISELMDWFRWGLRIITPAKTNYMIPVSNSYKNDLVSSLKSLGVDIMGLHERKCGADSSELKKKEYIDFDYISHDNNAGNIYPLADGDMRVSTKSDNLLYDHLMKDNNPIVVISRRDFKILKRTEKGFAEYDFFIKHSEMIEEIKIRGESEGTIKLILILSELLSSIRQINTTIIIDELESNLHTILIQQLMDMFYKGSFDCSQVIITTHETRLLNENVRNDEIWFVEATYKNNEKKSVLYSLEEFKEIDESNIDDDYLAGRYGAIPLFKQ